MDHQHRVQLGGFDFVVPDMWECEATKCGLAVFRSIDGVGAVNLSTFVKAPSAPRAHALLEDIVRSQGLSASIEKLHLPSGLECASTQYVNDDFWWRAWMILDQQRVLYATYNCRLNHKGKEDRPVDGLLASVRIA